LGFGVQNLAFGIYQQEDNDDHDNYDFAEFLRLLRGFGFSMSSRIHKSEEILVKSCQPDVPVLGFGFWVLSSVLSVECLVFSVECFVVSGNCSVVSMKW
jgi:hypothetical protein